VDSLLDAPEVVLLALSLGAALLLIEIALPTYGVAGTLAALLGIAGVAAIDRQQADWWPLLGPALGVVLGEVLIARRQRVAWVEGLAVALFAGGAVAFGVLADSPGTALVGVVLTVGLAAAFPALHRAANRLLDRPMKTGMEALVGQRGTVVRWAGSAGTVLLQGSRWNAVGAELAEGDEVEVVGSTGSTIAVARATTPSGTTQSGTTQSGTTREQA
jgi:membrane-bound ClpP family serine protease